MSDAVRYERHGPLAVVQLDDGKANALSPEIVRALDEACARAEEEEAGALLLLGRPGRFSAGFDLGVMRQGGAGMAELVRAGARLALRLYECPCPVVIGCTGHALAMGAVLLLSADLRIGSAGAFKIGLNEVAIGITLPPFAIALARERLCLRHLARATACAEIYDPAGAVEAGFLDRVVAPEALAGEARAEAERLAGLPRAAHRATKRSMRSERIAAVRAGLESDRVDAPTAI